MANWMATLETPEMKTIITHTQELTTALSSDPDLIAGALLSTKFIQDDSMLKILSGETPAGKAAILVEAVRNEIEVAPEKFSEFLDILSEQSWTKEVVESIFSTYQMSSVSAKQVLTERDVVALMNLIHNFSDKWNEIGLGLGFAPSELKQISSNPSLFMSAPASFLTELLSQWVRWPTVTHPTKPTLRALCGTLCSSLVGLGNLAEKLQREIECSTTGLLAQVKAKSIHADQDKPIDTAKQIENFEHRFSNLHEKILLELVANDDINTVKILNTLTLLPMQLRKEYEKAIKELLPAILHLERINELFYHLNPLLSFLDYGLLEYIIKRFGSDVIKEDMKAYSSDMQVFMKQTTIHQLIDHLPGQQEAPPNFSILKAKIGKNAKTYTLAKIDTLRKRICAEIRLSEIVFRLIALEESNSFIVSWLVPTVFVSNLVESAREIQKHFFQTENIASLSIGNLNVIPFVPKQKEQYQYMIQRMVEAKYETPIISLLRCLYEAQDPSLCLYVAERLEYDLDISGKSLSPLDCLSVSFFLSSVNDKEISVHLLKCSINDLGAKCLTKYLGSPDTLHVGKVTINVFSNEIHEEGTSHIARLLYYNIEHLYFSYNPIGDTGASLISEAVIKTVTLKTLILSKCVITSRGAENLSRALALNSSLEKFDIGNNNLGDEGISHMAEALRQDTQLKELWIGDCGMTDKGAASLASALSVNNSLKMLCIGGTKGALTEAGLSTITQSLTNNSKFVKLEVSFEFGFAAAIQIRQEVNEARGKSGLPPIEIEAAGWSSHFSPSEY